eukprot:bmy_04360T0
MFVSCSGWGLGCLRLCLLRVWAREVAGRCACGACQARLYGSDLNIKSSGSGCVKVQNIECDNCKIETEQGTSILQSVKV